MSSAERRGPSTPAAEIFTRGDHRVFVAESFEIVGDLLMATGRRRQRIGPAHASTVRWGPRETFYWPVRELRKIRVFDREFGE